MVTDYLERDKEDRDEQRDKCGYHDDRVVQCHKCGYVSTPGDEIERDLLASSDPALSDLYKAEPRQPSR